MSESTANLCRVKNSGVRECPGLTRTKTAAIFTDSRGRAHDLIESKRVPLKAVASMVGKSYSWVRQSVGNGTLYPVLEIRGIVVSVYEVAIEDWRARQVIGRGMAAAKSAEGVE